MLLFTWNYHVRALAHDTFLRLLCRFSVPCTTSKRFSSPVIPVFACDYVLSALRSLGISGRKFSPSELSSFNAPDRWRREVTAVNASKWHTHAHISVDCCYPSTAKEGIKWMKRKNESFKRDLKKSASRVRNHRKKVVPCGKMKWKKSKCWNRICVWFDNKKVLSFIWSNNYWRFGLRIQSRECNFLMEKVRSASPKLIHGEQSYISEVKISRNSGDDDGGREEPCSLCSLNVPHLCDLEM